MGRKSLKGGAEFFENPLNIIVIIVFVLLIIVFIYYVYIWWVNKQKVATTDISGNKVKSGLFTTTSSSITPPSTKESMSNLKSLQWKM